MRCANKEMARVFILHSVLALKPVDNQLTPAGTLEET
jgi:hypothetical protein